MGLNGIICRFPTIFIIWCEWLLVVSGDRLARTCSETCAASITRWISEAHCCEDKKTLKLPLKSDDCLCSTLWSLQFTRNVYKMYLTTTENTFNETEVFSSIEPNMQNKRRRPSTQEVHNHGTHETRQKLTHAHVNVSMTASSVSGPGHTHTPTHTVVPISCLTH